MIFEWLAENIFSVLVLFAVVSLLTLLVISMFKEQKVARRSENPRCCGCPHAKSCKSACTKEQSEGK